MISLEYLFVKKVRRNTCGFTDGETTKRLEEFVFGTGSNDIFLRCSDDRIFVVVGDGDFFTGDGLRQVLVASRVSHSFDAGGTVTGNITAVVMDGSSVHVVVEDV